VASETILALKTDAVRNRSEVYISSLLVTIFPYENENTDLPLEFLGIMPRDNSRLYVFTTLKKIGLKLERITTALRGVVVHTESSCTVILPNAGIGAVRARIVRTSCNDNSG
jgi:hypothetical protein